MKASSFPILILVALCWHGVGPTCTRVAKPCKKGLTIPLWKPTHNISLLTKFLRGAVYFLCLVYMFAGISIIADSFMAAIEVITSQEREISVKRPDKSTIFVSVRIWNETISNLTLMALGSSAPEILLSVIEIFKDDFEAGELGPSTIIGSAAFNLFVIIAICILAIPKNEFRKIKNLGVFILTAIWSIFAYFWLYLILSVFSPKVITLTEAFITLAFFPLTVISAFIMDKKMYHKFLPKKFAITLKRTNVEIKGRTNIDLIENETGNNEVLMMNAANKSNNINGANSEFEQTRVEFLNRIKEIRQKNPSIDMNALETEAIHQMLHRGPKSRAFYRIQATRKLVRTPDVKKAHASFYGKKAKPSVVDESTTQVFFDPGHYNVMENAGKCRIIVSRRFGDLNKSTSVDYKTVDGTAHAGSDYIYSEEDVLSSYFIKRTASSSLLHNSENNSLLNDGRPILDAPSICNITITENKDNKPPPNFDYSFVIGTSTWREQFVQALSLSSGEQGEKHSILDYIIHSLLLFWKLIGALIPPTQIWNGWLCFFVAILFIGVMTMIIGDLASAFGCTVGLKDSVTAITFVALGTSVPDTFASKISAVQDSFADASVGNVTGSNAVNVFLGIGVAWSIAAISHWYRRTTFSVDPGSLAFSVSLFSFLAVCTIMLLLIKRYITGSELGGPVRYKYFFASLLIFFWLIYITLFSAVSYCYIPAF